LPFSVIPDRSQGRSSLNPGEIELVRHRRCDHDDNRGLGEASIEFLDGVGFNSNLADDDDNNVTNSSSSLAGYVTSINVCFLLFLILIQPFSGPSVRTIHKIIKQTSFSNTIRNYIQVDPISLHDISAKPKYRDVVLEIQLPAASSSFQN
jgi:hypothetical protein